MTLSYFAHPNRKGCEFESSIMVEDHTGDEPVMIAQAYTQADAHLIAKALNAFEKTIEKTKEGEDRP